MSYQLSDVKYQEGKYFVLPAKHGFEVYKSGITHAERCAIIGWEGEKGLERSIAEVKRRIKKDACKL